MTSEIAAVMETLAEYLKLDGRSGKARGVSAAANAILRAKYLPPDPCDIDGIGPAYREVVNQIRRTGTCDELEMLKDRYSYYEELQDVKGIGPELAKSLNREGNIETKEELEESIESGEILEISGIGPATRDKFKRNL